MFLILKIMILDSINRLKKGMKILLRLFKIYSWTMFNNKKGVDKQVLLKLIKVNWAEVKIALI